MKKIPVTIILLAFCCICFAQIDAILWQNCLGTDEGSNKTNAVEKSGAGYLFGINLSKDGPGITNFHGGGDSWIVNTDSVGNIIWERCYGGSEVETSHKIINIDGYTFYLLNSSSSQDGDVQNGRGGNFWVVKINTSGDILWENSYGGSVIGEEVRDAILMPENGLLLMGRISSTGGDITTHYGDMDIWLCRIDSVGNILWEKTYGNQGRDNALKIKLTTNNTILMIGGHYKSGGMIDCPQMGTDGADVWVVEMDLRGTLLNQWCFGGNHNDLGRDIIEVEDGYVFVANTNSDDGDVSGLHGPAGENKYDDIWVVKIDFNGNIIWQKCLGGYSWEYPVYLTQTGDNGFIIIGNTCSLDGDVTGNHSLYDFYADIWVVKVNSEGDLEWEHCFGGGSVERFFGIHSVLKKDDYNYVLGANADYLDGDVECDLFPNDLQDNSWLLEIKDCNYYAPGVPANLAGPETLCSVADPTSSYSSFSSPWASGYEWIIEPENAGTIISNDTNAQITWDSQFEGPVSIRSRSYNDCGYSAWSEPFITQVYTCLGVNDQGSGEAEGQGGMVVWPNPASGVLSVKCLGLSSGNSYSLSVVDIFGREVSLPRLGEGQGGGRQGWTIDVSALPPGIYLAVLKDGHSVIASARFMVVRFISY